MKGTIGVNLVPYPGYEQTTVDGEPAFVYPRGARVAGTVEINATQMIKARAVEVSMQWHTTGKGDSDRSQFSPLVIHPGGELTGLLTLPFELDIPLAPLSYSGNLIKVEWNLRVRIDRPWAIDMKHNVVIVVV